MRWNKFIVYISAVIISFCLNSCNSYSSLKLVNSELDSFKMNGFLSAEMVLKLGLDNPGKEFGIKELRGKIYYKDVFFANFYMDEELRIERGMKEYKPIFKLAVDQNVPVLKILSVFRLQDLKEQDLYMVYDVKISPAFMPDYWLKNNRQDLANFIKN